MTPSQDELKERVELFARAAPLCQADSCIQPVLRAETRWVCNGDGDWMPGHTHLVCAGGHRCQVEFI